MKDLIQKLFFDQQRYDLGVVGRFMLNKKLDLLPLRLHGRAAQLQMVEHRAAAEHLGTDEPRGKFWRNENMDCQCGRPEAYGISN